MNGVAQRLVDLGQNCFEVVSIDGAVQVSSYESIYWIFPSQFLGATEPLLNSNISPAKMHDAVLSALHDCFVNFLFSV